MNDAQKRGIFYTLFFGQIVGLVAVWYANTSSVLASGGGSALIAYGGLWGLIAGYFFLYQLILISGTRFFEKYFGLDRLARIHHVNGFVGYFFLIAHVLFIVSGYSAQTGNGFGPQILELSQNLPYVWLASIALILLDIVIITSIVIVRKRLKYELWYFVHLLVYAAVLLALFHQITNGRNLLSNDWLRYYWLGLYIAAFSLVLWKRWLSPVWINFKHRLKVDQVVKEAEGITSIYITGKNLKDFKYQAGQFNLWHFWQAGLRSMHHPFSISSSPSDPFLRLSVKAIGDFTSKIHKLKPGTSVLVSGPYGRFTATDGSSKRSRLFIAGGIGVTPLRSMLGEHAKKGDVLLYAAKKHSELAFYDEFESMKKSKGLKIVYILSDDKVEGAHHGYLTKEILDSEVDNIQNRDIWLCGPPPMMAATEKILSEMNVEDDRIYTEKFRL